MRDAVNAGRATAAASNRRGRKRRVGTVVGLSVLVVLLAGTLVVALGAQAMVSRVSCQTQTIVATVGVSDDIAPAVERVGQLAELVVADAEQGTDAGLPVANGAGINGEHPGQVLPAQASRAAGGPDEGAADDAGWIQRSVAVGFPAPARD